MANSDKNIRITTNRDTTALPKIIFTGQSNNPIALNVLDDNTISFEGSAGQLFSINNNLSSGYIFSINDISGIPSFRVNADGTVGIAEFLGNVGIGLTNPAYKLQISGSAGISGTANISGVLTLSSTTGSGSTSTGALVVSGGVGIGGSIFSSSAYASSLSGVVFNNGAITNTGTITSTGVMSISNSSTTAFQVRDGSNNPAFVIDTIGDIISLPVAIASTTTGTGSLVVAGGVGIGGSVNVGGRVGIGTNLLTGQINIRTSSASTPGIVVQGSTSQTEDYLRIVSSTGTTSLTIDSSYKIAWPNTGTNPAKIYGTTYSTQGRVVVEGNLYVSTGPFIVNTGGGEASMGSNYITFASGVGLGVDFTPARLTTNNALRIQPTSTSVVPLVVQLQNASWTSGNAFEIQNNGDLRFSVDYTGSTRVLSTAGSASTTTGALVITGGVGIGQTLFTSPSYASSVSGVILNNGTITGSLSGTATTANNVRIASAGNSNSNHLITFTPNSSSSGSAISSDSTFSFNPSTEILSVSGIAITSGIASTSTTTGALVVSGGMGIGNTLYVAGRVDASNYKAWVENRTLSSVDTCVGIGTFFIDNGAHNILISLNVSDGGYSVAKNYTLTSNWNIGGWSIVAPLSSTGAYGNNSAINFQLEAYQGSGSLTLRARSLGAGGSLKIYVQNVGQNTATFTAYNSATSETAISLYHPYAFTSQENNVLKINSSTASTSTSTGALVVTGGVGIGQSLFTSSSYASSISGVTFNNGAITNTGTITSTGVMSISNSSTTAFAVKDGSNSSKFNVDTVGGIVSVLSSTASTSTSFGALVVSGGVGIGQSVIIGGRVGIGTVPNLSMLNIRTSSVGTTGLSISASPSQSANLFEWYADGGVGGGYSLSGRIRPSGHVNLGNPGTINMSTGTSALLSLQGRGSTEGLAIRGFNSNLNEPLFEIQGNPGNQLFGIYGDGGVNAPRINVTNSTGSTTTSTGALIVTGGVGIGGSLYVASATAISGVTINAGVITGNLTGTATTSGFATTSNYSNQSGYGITAGLATTATYSHQAGYAITTGSSATATTATYSHQSGYGITAGLATTATYSHQAGYAITSGSSATATTATYALQSGYATTSGLATTATYSHQSGYAITSGSSGSATTANNINVANALSNSAHTLLFSPTATGSGVAVSSNTTLSYNPSTNILSTSGLAITATTASSSTSNGALQVAGGVGISGRLSFNQAAFGTTGIATNPTMAMIGNTGDPIFLSILEDNTISFEGSQGQLFSITPNLSTGYIYSVNDITGIPLLRANANANVTANEYAGNFGIGLSNPGYKLHVVGSVGFTSTTASTSTTTGTLVVSGGVGIGGSINVNSASNISNVIINNGVITGNLSGTATTSGFATTASYSNQAGYAITAGSATTALYSHQAGYAITSGSATTAVTSVSSTSVSVASAGSSNLAHPILITNNPSSGSAVSSDSTFTFNPSTEILSVSGILITASTGSSNTSTGALIVTGGVGIGGSFNVGNKTRFNDEVYINTISDNALVVGGSGSVSYRWNVGSTLTANRFNLGSDLSLSPVGGNQSVVQSFWGLQLTGNTFVTPGGFTPTSYGSAGAIGVLVPNQQASRVAFGIIAHASQTGDLQIWTSSTASTSSPYLAVRSNGQLYSYANIPATSFDSGALVVSGGVGIGGSLFVNGDLTINGTTTTINSVTLSVDDKNIELGSVSSPSDVTAEGGGITLKGTTDKNINWYSGVGWSSSESWNLVSGNAYKINNSSVLTSTTLGTGVTNSSLTSLGTITTGVWAGTLITAQYGGIGLTTPFTVGDILYANTSTTWGRLTAGTSGHLLSSTGTGSTPSYVNPNTLTVGSATTAANLRIAVASSNLSHPVLFTPGSSTSGSAVSSDSTFSFNSSTEILSVSGLAVTSATSSSGSTTGALTVAGGVGIGGTVNIAGDETVLGRLYYSQSTVGVAGTSTIPSISFIGQDNNPITLSVLTDNTLSFEGSSGQLFSINNNLSSGTIFSVNDISGIPIIRANANGTLSMGEFTGTVGVGLTNPSFKFHVSGSAGFSGTIYATGNVSLASNTASTSTTNGALTVAGGVGIGGSLYVASATAISGVTINAGVITGSLTGLATTATYSHQSGYAITSGIATTAGYASIANTSYSVNVNSASGNSSHYLIFSPNASGSGIALSTESALVYNPSTDILSVSGIAITSSTASTSTSTGALVVTGGVGIGQSLFTSSSYPSSISGVTLNNGAITNTGTITSTGVMSISNSSTTAFSVKDGSNDTKFNVNTIGGIVSVSSSTASTNTSTGALTVTGGVGIGGTLNASRVKATSKITFEPGTGTSAVSGWTGIGLTSISKMIYGGGRFVGVGGSYAAYSTDGVNFTYTTIPGSTSAAQYVDVAYGNGVYVAGNLQDVAFIAYSYDGAAWGTTSLPRGLIRTVCFGNGKFLAFNEAPDVVYSSTDGRNWTTIGNMGQYGREASFANGYFLSTRGYNLYYSVDGASWKPSSIPYSQFIFSVAYGKGLYIAPEYNSAILHTSTDLVTWTQRSIPNLVWTGASYVNGVFYLIPNGDNRLYHSIDGINWSNTNFGTPIGGTHKMFTANDRLYLFSSNGPTLWSTDATTGTLMAKPFYNGELENTRIGAVNPDSATFTHLAALNPVNFTSSTASTGTDNGALTVKGGVGIGGTLNANTARVLNNFNHTPSTGSTGGIAWTSVAFPSIPGLANNGFDNSVVYGRDKFVGIGGTNVFYSYDSYNWFYAPIASATTPRCITYGNDMYIAINNTGNGAYYSYNGINWSTTTLANSTTNGDKACFGNGRFVYNDQSGNVGISTNGINWTVTLVLSGGAYPYGVDYANGWFFARWQNNYFRSADLINWNRFSLPADSSRSKIFFSKNKYYAPNNNASTYFVSDDGFNWTTQAVTNALWINMYDYFGTLYLIRSLANAVSYSEDGINWGSASLGGTSNTNATGLVYGNGRFVYVGSSPNLIFSGNAPVGVSHINTPRTSELDNVRIGANSPASAQVTGLNALGSVNFSSTTNSTSPFNGALTVTGGVGVGGTLTANDVNVVSRLTSYASFGSTGGLSWTQATLPANYTEVFNSIVYGNGKFAAVGYTAVLTSTDAVTWEVKNISWPSVPNNSTIKFLNSKFIVVAANNSYIAYSDDAVTWQTSTTPVTSGSMVYNNGRYYKYSGSTVGISTNLSNWTSQTTNGYANRVLNGYFYNNSQRSIDGINFESLVFPGTTPIDINYGNGIYFGAVYNSSIYYTSTDGLNFTQSTIESNVYLGAEYYNGVYYLRCQHNIPKLYYSLDGYNYSSVNLFSNQYNVSMAFGNNKIVYIGFNPSQINFLAYSDATRGVVDLNTKFEGSIDNVVIGRRNARSASFLDVGISGKIVSNNTASSSTLSNNSAVFAGGVGIGQTLFTSASYASSVSGVILSNGTVTGNLTGTATTATYAHQAGYAITSGSSGSATTATYAHQSGYATTSGFATTATYAHQSGYGITAGFATSSTSASIANTSYSVNVNAASANSSHFLIFSPTATGSGVALSTESALVYNPSTDILSVSGLAVTSGTASTSATTGALVVTGGVGIGQTLTVGLGISTPSVSAPANLIIKPGVDSTTGIQLTRSSSAIPVISIDTLNSRVGIGLTNPEFDLEVNGSISATTKSFVIEHPTKEGMKLRYGSLEGPENGVYVRGELKDNNTIILPDYWSELIDESSITVHLTPIGNKFVYVKEIKKDSIIVGCMFFQKIHCYYSVWAERKDVPKLKVEF